MYRQPLEGLDTVNVAEEGMVMVYQRQSNSRSLDLLLQDGESGKPRSYQQGPFVASAYNFLARSSLVLRRFYVETFSSN